LIIDSDVAPGGPSGLFSLVASWPIWRSGHNGSGVRPPPCQAGGTERGPPSVTITGNPVDKHGNFPVTGTLNSSGFGFFLENLTTAGSYELTATAGSLIGSSTDINVTPAGAVYFTVATPAAAITGAPESVTVTAFDKYNNVATGYTGTIKLTSSDSAASLGGTYSFTAGAGQDNGVHTFSATLNTAGKQTMSATDTTAMIPTITGTSNAILSEGLMVTNFTPTPTGFKAIFNKPFKPEDLTLYGPNLATVKDVTLVGSNSKVGAIHGSLIIDPTNTSFTFSATSSYLSLKNVGKSVVLPDDTYTVTLVSGSGGNGFLDALNQ
jgi:hypothetical protein